MSPRARALAIDGAIATPHGRLGGAHVGHVPLDTNIRFLGFAVLREDIYLGLFIMEEHVKGLGSLTGGGVVDENAGTV